MPAATTNLIPARAIVRCANKTCRRPHRLDFATTYEPYESFGRMAVRRTAIVHDRETSYRDRYDLARIALRGFTCTGCRGTLATFKVIEGSYSEAVKCGPRCRNAVGPSCDCQCGGERHGEGHTAL